MYQSFEVFLFQQKIAISRFDRYRESIKNRPCTDWFEQYPPLDTKQKYSSFVRKLKWL